MLLEKYMQAAETIVAAAVRAWAASSRRDDCRKRLRNSGDKQKGDRFSFYDEAKLARKFQAEHAGSTSWYWSSRCLASLISIQAVAGWCQGG